jgi:hypothetical protein
MADGGTLAAVGAAVVSAGGALWSLWTARRLERDKAESAAALKRLEAELSAAGKLADARTRYEWEARTRLYDEVEPVLFLTGEVLEMTFARLANMAQAAAGGRLGAGEASWLRGPDNYYLLTTAFRVLRPLACLRMLTEKLTRLDFSLDARIQSAYVLAKLYRDALSGPFDLAAQAPVRPYRYVAPEPNRPYAVEDEAVQHMQHLYTDDLEALVETLLVRDQAGQARLKRYGEFRAEVLDPAHETAKRMAPALLLFRHMAPGTRPVLWRALMACAVIAKVMLDVLAERGAGAGRSLGGRLEQVRGGAWLAELRFADEAAVAAEIEAVVAALRARLGSARVAHIRLA